MHETHWNLSKVVETRFSKKKKKKRNADTDTQGNQSNPNGHILLEGIINFIQFI